MTTLESLEQTTEQRDALAGRLFESTIATMDVLAVYLGDQLGLYRALADLDSATSTELAAATGTQERYVREWLEQQAVTGIVAVEDAEAGADVRRYRLPAEWIPAMPDVHARLQAGTSARVADIGCGAGWSSIAIAQAYPNVIVDGFDNDEPSIVMARANAAEAGVADRVRFHARDAGDPALVGRYDLVTAFECVHDLSQPVEVLRTTRRLLGEGGTMLIVDERVAETFTAPGDQVERLFYGFSVLCCLPAGLAEQPSAGTGTVMRPEMLHRYATEAGFGTVEILPIEHDLFRFYRLTR